MRMQVTQKIYDVTLNPYPLVPINNHNELNEVEVGRWIGAHPAQMRESLSELSKKVEHISFNVFDSNFQTGISFFNKLLRDEKVTDYIVMVEPGKSNQWLAEIALPKLVQQPTQITDLGKKGAAYSAYLLKEENKKKPYIPNSVVFFDDGIYSGKQMASHIQGVLEATHQFNKNRILHGLEEIVTPNIIVVCPYATEFGERTIRKINANDSELIQMSPHEKIKTLAEVVSESTREVLEKTLWLDDPRDRDTNLWTTPFRQGTQSRGNIWFDHKIPNWLSFVHALEAGIVTGLDGMPMNGRLTKNENNEPIFIPEKGKSYAPIPETIQPYSPKFNK
jgi:hypothetical protein